MAEKPLLKDRGFAGRLARLKLLAYIECVERDAEFKRRRYAKYLDEQFAKLMGATAPIVPRE